MIQWWSDGPLNTGETFQVTYQTCVNDYVLQTSTVTVDNFAALSLAGGEPFLTAEATALLAGPYTVSGTTFTDNGVAGTKADGIYTVGEPTISNLTVTLYVDTNNDGLIDSGDLVAGTQTTNARGFYTFTMLPTGNYLVAVDLTDPDVPTGSSVTTNDVLDVTILNANVTDQNFGFLVPLSIDKQVVGASVVNAGDMVSYTIDVTNQMVVLPENPTIRWAQNADGNAGNWKNTDASGGNVSTSYAAELNSGGSLEGPELDGKVVISEFRNGSNGTLTSVPVSLKHFDLSQISGTILSIEAVVNFYVGAATVNAAENLSVSFNSPNNTYDITLPAISNTILNSAVGAAQARTVSAGLLYNGGTFSLSDFENGTLSIFNTIGSPRSNTSISIDSFGLRVTTDFGPVTGFDPNTTIQTFRLTDSYNPVEL